MQKSAADRVVPPTGMTVWLTMGAACAMAFLATFALALDGAAGRLAGQWDADLDRSATVQLPSDVRDDPARQDAAVALLRATPGIADARPISAAEQAGLLEPWIGTSLPVADLPLPALIAVTEDATGADFAGLRLRLAGEFPGAVLDDHTGWRQPMMAAADRLRWVSALALTLIGLATAAMIVLAAQSALEANRSVVTVLRQIGAKDRWIAAAFTRRFTLRAGVGAGGGALIACGALWAWPVQEGGAAVLTDLGFRGLGWIGPLCLPLLCALIAKLATHLTAMRILKGLT